MSIEVGASLIPGTANTPLDARCRVTQLSDIPNISNPFLGMEFFCIANGKTYKVISLKSKAIGSMTVANGAVDDYEEIPDAVAFAALEKRVEALENADPEDGSGGTTGEEGEGDGTNSSPETVTATISTLMLTKPANGLFLIIRKAGADGSKANSTVIIDTLNNPADRQKVKGYLDSVEDGYWTICPEDGFSTPYDGGGIAVDLSFLTDLPCTLFYTWATDTETFADWQSITFPCCGGAGKGSWEGGSGGGTGSDRMALFCLCTEEPPKIFDGLIWVKGGTSDPQYVTVNGPANVVVKDSGIYDNLADGTIIIDLSESN